MERGRFSRTSLDGDDRKPEHALGIFGPLRRGPTELALTVKSRQAKPTKTGGSGWAGLPGAAIFSGVHLIEVMITDPAEYEESLVGRRASAFVNDPEPVDILGFVPPVDEVIGGRPESGLADNPPKTFVVGLLPGGGASAQRERLASAFYKLHLDFAVLPVGLKQKKG